MSCLFCDITKDTDQKIIFKNDLVLFAQSEKYQGHLKNSGIIIPIAHRETVFDLTPEEQTATFELLIQAKTYLDQYKPDGYNVGWNCYPVGGQSIPHAHLHVIPRFIDEPLAGKGIRAYLKSNANRK